MDSFTQIIISLTVLMVLSIGGTIFYYRQAILQSFGNWWLQKFPPKPKEENMIDNEFDTPDWDDDDWDDGFDDDWEDEGDVEDEDW